MEFTTIHSKVQKIIAEFSFELARCNDVFRLNQLLKTLRKQCVDQQKETADMISSIDTDWLKKIIDKGD
jgi:hypothetical protein